MNTINIAIKETQIGAETVNAVDAYELYLNLEVTNSFQSWINAKLKSFVESSDFTTYIFPSTRKAQARYTYLLSLDTAKHLALMTNTNKGKEVRMYFIQAEKELRSIKQVCTMAEYNALLERVKLLEVVKTDEYFTMREYMVFLGLHGFTSSTVIQNGRNMTAYCRIHKIHTKKQYHVKTDMSSNTYPESALADFWAQ